MKILYGKKTTLLPFSAEADMAYFLKLLEHEGSLMGQCFFKSPESYLAWVLYEIHHGRWNIWTVLTKGGKPQKVGFIVLYDPSPFGATIQGLMDKSLLKGLPALLLRTDKTTYSEDALRTVVNHALLEVGVNRIGCEIMRCNTLARRLVEKVGFFREGKLREAASYKGRLEDVMIYSILKSDLTTKEGSNEQAQQNQPIGITGRVPAAVV